MLEKSDNMKRILSRAFFVIVLALLVQIPFNVSKAQDVQNDSSVKPAETVRNTAVAADAVMLVVPETSVDHFYIYYKISDNQGYRYQWYFNYTEDTVTVGDSTQMTFKGFDWSIANEYIIVIETKKGVYKKVIKQTDMSKVSELKLDTAFSVVLPSDMQATYRSVDLCLLDNNGVRITSFPIELTDSQIENGFKIPYGGYDVDVSNYSGTLPCALYKHNYVLSASNNKIVFASGDIKKISLNLLQNNASKKTARIKGIGISYNSYGTHYVYPTITSGTSYILVSKLLCDITVFAEDIEDTYYEYRIKQTGVNTGSLNAALDFSLKMKTIMNLPVSITGGSDLTGFYIKNDLNQTITMRQGTKEFSGTVKLTGSSGAPYAIDVLSSNRITTKIPSVSELFSVSYTVPGTLTVTPSTGSVFIYIPYESGIISIEPDKPSPQLVGSTIRWNCKTFGDNSNNQYHFEVFNGSTLVASSAAYSSAKYFDWTPKEPGTKYRVVVYMSNAQTQDGHKTVSKTSAYYTISAPAPIAITSLTPDKASPQSTGTKIRWTCNITGGKAPVYYFRIYKGSTVVTQSSDYSTNNCFDWTPTAAGTDYRALVYVKENGASYTTRVEKYSGNYTISAPAPIAITSILPDKASPQLTGTKIRWTTTISGGKAPVYYFRIYKGSTVVTQSSDYSTNNYFDWTPTAAGTDYRALVYVKENGASYTTRVEKYSGYYTISTTTPIAITSILPDKASPQPTGTKIRWTCNITGGKAPVYYFRIYKGSTLVTQSSDYSTNNCFDWTPTAAGTDYRALVYVKENGALYTTRVEKYSSYYTVSTPAPIAITSIVPGKASPQSTGTKIRWTCNITGGKAPVYYFRIYKGNTVVIQSSDYSTNNCFDWTPTAAGTDYRALVYVKENGASYTTRVEKYSSYFTVTAAAPITITSLTPNPASPQEICTSIRWTCEVSGGISPVYYFEIFDGTSMIAHSADYTTNNYIDWTPFDKGSNYRVKVYVKEKGSSSYVTKTSGYYTITGPVLKVVDNSVAAVAADKIEVTFDADIGSCSPYVFDVRSGPDRDSERISYFDFCTTQDRRTLTFRLFSPIGTDPSGLWLVPIHPELAKDVYGTAMSPDAPSMRIIDKARPVVLSVRVISASVEVKFSENVSIPDISALLSDLSIKKVSDGSVVSLKAGDITIEDKRIVIEGLESGVEYKLSFLTGTSVVDNSPAHNTLVPYQVNITTGMAEFRLLTAPDDTVIRFPRLHK